MGYSFEGPERALHTGTWQCITTLAEYKHTGRSELSSKTTMYNKSMGLDSCPQNYVP